MRARMFIAAGFMGQELEAAWVSTPGERVIHGGGAPVQPAGARDQVCLRGAGAKPVTERVK